MRIDSDSETIVSTTMIPNARVEAVAYDPSRDRLVMKGGSMLAVSADDSVMTLEAPLLSPLVFLPDGRAVGGDHATTSRRAT